MNWVTLIAFLLIAQGSDPLRRITQITHQKPDTTPLLTHDYTHDQAGQLTSASRSSFFILPSSLSYSYDPTGQLTSVLSDSAPLRETFSYDPAGNRLTSTRNQEPETHNYTIGANNRITSDGTYNYQYDDEGNLIQKSAINHPQSSIHYTYDHRNRLTSVSSPSSTVNYAYDALDRRVAKSVATSTSTENFSYFYHGEMIWKELRHAPRNYDPDIPPPPITQIWYLNGESIDSWQARQVRTSGQLGYSNLQWFLSDRMGTIQVVTNPSGDVLESYDYSAFGVRSILNSQFSILTSNPLGFTGREHDAETGLIYYRARYMDPVLGRFISEDPIGFAAGDFNVGRYVTNNPQNSVDPYGLATVDYLAKARESFSTGGRLAVNLWNSCKTSLLAEVGHSTVNARFWRRIQHLSDVQRGRFILAYVARGGNPFSIAEFRNTIGKGPTKGARCFGPLAVLIATKAVYDLLQPDSE